MLGHVSGDLGRTSSQRLAEVRTNLVDPIQPGSHRRTSPTRPIKIGIDSTWQSLTASGCIVLPIFG
jgi:hypothetical protein